MPINSDYYSRQGHVANSNTYLIFKPTLPLSHWLQEFWQLNVPAGKYYYRSIPDNCVDIIINLNNPEEMFIVTPFSSAKVFEMHGPVSYFGIRFRPLGHHGLISAPMGYWNNADNVVDAYELLSKQVLDILIEGACQSMSFQRRSAHYSMMLLEVLHNCEIDIRLVRYLQYCGQNITSTVSLSDKQCTEFGVSARQLRRLTSQYLGLSPKSYSNILRFQQTLQIMNTQGSAAIWANSYYDQAHFIREFKNLSGVTPNKFKRLSVLYNTEPLKN